MDVTHVWLNELDQLAVQHLMNWTRLALQTPASSLQEHLHQLTARPWTPRRSWMVLMASTALQTARG